MQHSLGTTPDAVLLQLRSQSVTSVTQPIAEGGNASLSSVGQVGVSTTYVNSLSIYFWTPIR